MKFDSIVIFILSATLIFVSLTLKDCNDELKASKVRAARVSAKLKLYAQFNDPVPAQEAFELAYELE